MAALAAATACALDWPVKAVAVMEPFLLAVALAVPLESATVKEKLPSAPLGASAFPAVAAVKPVTAMSFAATVMPVPLMPARPLMAAASHAFTSLSLLAVAWATV